MLWRRMHAADLEACMAIEPRHLGADLVGADEARSAWSWLLRNSAFNSALIEADPASDDGGILGFGASVFTSRDFVDAELANPRPGLNGRVMASIVEGNPVVLNYQQLRRGNTRHGLDVVGLAGSYRRDASLEFSIQIRATLASAFVEAHSGYRIRRVIGEPVGAGEIAGLQGSGVWHCVADFGERALFVMTRDDAYANPISNMIQVFECSDPLLGLREADQRLLQAASTGLTDDELAASLGVHVGTVKKRWLEIYDRIINAFPELFTDCHPGNGQARGKQKRHLILSYVRQHPEELRPFEQAPVRQTQTRRTRSPKTRQLADS